MTDKALNSLLETVWQHLTRGVADRKHSARHPTLATVGPDGPELRTLVLRGASPQDATLTLHTDRLSPKVSQITSDPRVALHVWLPKPRLQIRLRATAVVTQGDPSLFERLPPEAQANYGGAAPGTPLPASGPDATATRFTELTCHLTEADVLHLDTPHRRALYTAKTAWVGQWVRP